jgi:hypothetical protein
MYYGWRVVAVCFVAASFTWGFGVYGASVYLSQITVSLGWPVALVSGGVTAFYLANAASLAAVGSAVDRWGARPMFLLGAAGLAVGMATMGQVTTLWQLYAAFVLIGLGYACLSLTGLTAALNPWFDRYQGRSVAIALMGASIGGMVVVPLLVLAIGQFGFSRAMVGSAALTVAVLIPLVAVVLRYHGPTELGLVPDGERMPDGGAMSRPAAAPVRWTRREAMATPAFWTTALAFAVGLAAQVGFFTHQVNFARPLLGAEGAGWLVGATGFANLLGRLLLARIVDEVPVRRYAAVICSDYDASPMREPSAFSVSISCCWMTSSRAAFWDSGGANRKPWTMSACAALAMSAWPLVSMPSSTTVLPTEWASVTTAPMKSSPCPAWASASTSSRKLRSSLTVSTGRRRR